MMDGLVCVAGKAVYQQSASPQRDREKWNASAATLKQRIAECLLTN
jgi:hypothetical protein